MKTTDKKRASVCITIEEFEDLIECKRELLALKKEYAEALNYEWR